MTKILFVCHGNICRSPMAEFVMKDMVRKAGLEKEILVDSKACRTDEIGSDTYYGTKNKLREEGIPFTPRRASQITYADYAEYDYIIGMDGENMRDLQRLTHGDPQGKTYRLLELAGETRDVADPWYTDDFTATYRDVTKGCAALLMKLKD
ncbi:MAG: low molecular weight phosphotyrosine protein phosphatase [Selenomonadaceae bacterium]|nr:low molecular weight phosphotyrosine protein phosphatase [Selenomonadaceae bacterium]